MAQNNYIGCWLLLKSSKRNFFVSIYLFIRFIIFKKNNRKEIKNNKTLQASHEKNIKDHLKINEDWFSHNINTLDFFFKKNKCYEKKINMLEIGSYEGNSSVFFLKYFPKLNLTCVDTFEGGIEQGNSSFDQVYENFNFNVSQYKDRLKIIRDTSDSFFNSQDDVLYDLVYIDGSHHYDDVLNDARNSYKSLKKDGYLIFDDFLWNFYSNPNENPIGAIKLFLKENFFKLKIVSIGYQIILKKL
tara:strand:+ start:28 stop:759 length:732 start_codon:yes stop_codon:yes gene_type:complete